MERIEKTVFISYRRTNVSWALAIYQDLTARGYDVFFDYQSIDSGNFEQVILENIKSRAHFLVILTPSTLDRCKEPGDWLRREIETAIDERRNIVPLLFENFDFGNSSVTEALTGKLAHLKSYNGLRLYAEYFFEGMEKLRGRFLNIPTREVDLASLNTEVQKIVATQKTAVEEADHVRKEHLVAQEWYERGYVFHESRDIYEALRCYVEAIRLDPDLRDAFVGIRTVLKQLQRQEEKRRKLDEILSTAKEHPNLAGSLVVGERMLKLETDYPLISSLDAETVRALDEEAELPDKENPTAEEWYEKGQALQIENKPVDAIRCYAEAILLKPAFNEAFFQLEKVRLTLVREDLRYKAQMQIRAMDAIAQTLNYFLSQDPKVTDTVKQLLKELGGGNQLQG
jgi:tetratricopeptide (TPR) repeat protein